MFGYVRVNSAELKVKEYELYRGAYCGLCRAMGKCTGQCSRMSLSYDFAFLVMARLALTDTEVSFSQKRCMAHPLKKRSVMDRNEQLDVCAYSAAILGYHKVRDDLDDERGTKRLRARLMHPFVRSWRKKAIKAGMGELDEGVSKKLAELSELEGRALPSVDEPARIFGEILSDIVSYGLTGDEQKIACHLGRSVGKWIYIVDALDDMDEDRQRQRYNPFLLLYGGEPPSKQQLDSISDALKLELLAAEAAMDLIKTDKKPIMNILENTLYLGMPDVVQKTLGKSDGGDSSKGKEKADERSV